MASASDHTAARAARSFGAELEDDGLDADYSMIANDDDPEELDYYALLGLAQKPPPTEAEIRSAYRNLSLSFHPDKQPPHLRDAAQRQFTLIQEAYDALIDPQKRIVYDMLGAEGVRQEWSHGGTMGGAGEEHRRDVGVKTMSPDEFRQWFLKMMKKRERKALESMVDSRGAIALGITAKDLIRVDEDGDVTLGTFNDSKINSFGAKYQFKVPLHLPDFLTGREDKTETETGDEDQHQDETPGDNEPEEEENPLEVTLSAGVTGGVIRQQQPYYLSYEDRDEEVEVTVNAARILAATDIQLGAAIAPNFRALAGQKGLWGWRPFSFLRDSSVIVEGTILPERELSVSVARSIQPISGIKPISVTTSANIKYPLLEAPPNFEIQASKEIASGKIAFCSWKSGSWEWPHFLDRLLFLGMSPNTMCASEDDYSNFQIGLLSVPRRRVTSSGEDIDEEDEEAQQLLQKQKNIDRARETWQAVIQVSPVGSVLVLKYERNLFSGKPADDPVRSEWSGQGYFPMRKMEEARAVRLDISTNINPDLSIHWTVQGTRRVGEYTKIGLGVGIAPQGILMSVSWSRLGQQIKVPVIICPVNDNHDAAVLATVVPWLAYCAIEFGYIRPRDRKKRRQAAALRHKELKKRIPKKRAESVQAVELMSEQVSRRQAREEAQEGLIITKAEYGYIPSANKKLQSKFPDAQLIDVTIPIAALVDRSQLVIPENTVKFRIIGFYDPAPMLPKRLRIWYTFQGRTHFVDIGDKEGVACPMRSHLMS